MAVSLGGSLLTLSTLLCRPLSELGLQNLYAEYAEAFRHGLSLLQEIGDGLYAARRMLLDLKDIIHVVTAIIDRPATAPQQPPVNIPSNLFPYGAIDFAQQSGSGYPYESYSYANVQQNFGYDGVGPSWNGWDETNPNQGYGVPWI